MAKPETVTIAVRIPESTRRRLRVAAAASGVTIQDIVAQALLDALRKEGTANERKPKKRAPRRTRGK